MFTTLISLALVSTVALRGALAEFTVSSPAINENEPFHLTWSGQEGEVNAIIVDAAQPCDSLLVDLGDHSNGALTWPSTHGLTAGTKVQISLEDSKGEEAWSSIITVGKGNGTASSAASSVASASASVVPSGSSSVEAESATTLVIAATASPVGSTSSTGSGSSDDTPANAIGAVNQGVLSGAPALHKLSAPAVALTALAAVLAVSL